MGAEFKHEIDGDVLKVELPALMGKDFATELDLISKQWLLQASKLYAFNFKNVTEIKQPCYQSILVFSQLLKTVDKKIVSYNVNPVIENKFKLDGVTASLNIVKDFNHYFINNFQKVKPMQLDVKLINPFLAATQNTFEKQANTKCEPQKPKLTTVDAKTYDSPIALAGVVSLATDTFKGSITLAFSEKVFLLIYESMLGEKHDKINHEMEDAVGELLNIIYGTAKTVLNSEYGYQLKPVLPTVLSGEKINIRQHTKNKVIILPFKTQHGEFQVEISFETAA